MTEQDKQALIKHFCSRDCGEAAEGCTIMPCHEIELIQEFPTTEADSDTISRAKAIDALTEYGNGRAVFISVGEAVIRIEQLPPAQPERIKGRWISADTIFGGVPFYCSECGENTRDTVMGKPRWNFCPNCGAEMEVTT